MSNETLALALNSTMSVDKVLSACGTIANPAFTWLDDATSGIYCDGVTGLGFASGGVSKMYIDNTKITVEVPFQINDMAIPAVPVPLTYGCLYKKAGDDGLFWSVASGEVDITAGGVVFPLLATDGTALLPSYTFAADTNTGLFRSGADTLAFTTAGLNRMSVEANGTISVLTANYETLITNVNDIPNKAYVDSIATGLDLKYSVRVKTVGVLPAYTQAGSGIGATLTGNVNGVLTVDGVNTVLGDRILVDDLGIVAPASNRGIYSVTTEGTAGVPFVLTRATDADEDAEVTAGMFTFVTEGTVADTGWVLITNDPITVDTHDQSFTQFTGGGDNLGNHIATQQIRSTLGLVGAPGYSFNGDLTTGVWSSGAGVVNVSTGGAERLRVDAVGGVSIGSTVNANARSILDLTSTTRGALFPRMTTVQKNAIAAVAGDVGLTVYDTTLTSLQSWNGTAWEGASDNLFAADQTLNAARTHNGNNNDFAITSLSNFDIGINANNLIHLENNSMLLASSDVMTISAPNSLGINTGTMIIADATNTNSATIQLRERLANGASNVAVRCPDALAANSVFTLPPNTGTAGFVLRTDGTATGLTTWVDPASFHPDPHLLSNGTALAPVYSFAADANTGMYAPAADVLALSTGGVERLRVDAAGSVSVGSAVANVRSILDLTSTTRGALFPRMTTVQKNAIATVAGDVGLTVYDTTLTSLQSWNGTAWEGASDNLFAANQTLNAARLHNGNNNDFAIASLANFDIGVDNNSTNIHLEADVLTLSTDDTVTINATGAFDVNTGGMTLNDPSDSGAPAINFREQSSNGGSAVSVRAPTALAGGSAFTLPPNTGTAGFVLRTDGTANGLTTWVDPVGFHPDPHLLSNGTALAPVYSFAADTNTGMYAAAADVLALTTGGVERLRVDAVGGVSIGSTANANVRSILDLTSTTRGALFPRMTTVQKNAIAAVAGDVGLTVYDTTLTSLQSWNGTGWEGASDNLFTANQTLNAARTHNGNNNDFAIASLANFDIGINANNLIHMENDALVLSSGDTMNINAPSSLDINTGSLLLVDTDGGAAAQIQLREQPVNGGNVVTFTVPNALVASSVFTLPPNTGTAGFVLRTDGTVSGLTTWVDPASFHPDPHLLSNGTALAPVYSFAADANTGMYAAAADVLALTTGGVERLRVDAVGGVSIGSTANAAASSILDLTSTSRGVLFPRMTTVQRDAIAAPATGLLIYNTSTTDLETYNGATWQGSDHPDPHRLSDGTALAPVYSFVADTNTGIYRSAADTIALSTAGAVNTTFEPQQLTLYNLNLNSTYTLRVRGAGGVGQQTPHLVLTTTTANTANSGDVTVTTGDSNLGGGSSSGTLNLRTGSGINAGGINIQPGTNTSGGVGNVSISTAVSTAPGAPSGNVLIASGNSANTDSGVISCTTGTVAGVRTSGAISLLTGVPTVNGSSGSITLGTAAGSGTGNGGVINLYYDNAASAGFRVEADGTLSVQGTANYETLVLADDDIPNKRYVDDASTTVVTTNLLYVSTTGNDATALRHTPAQPFLTLEAARLASVAGDTIVVYPGTYAVTTTLTRTGVNWYFHPSAIITKANAGSLWQPTDATNPGHVYGHAEITITGGGLVFDGTAVGITRWICEAESITSNALIMSTNNQVTTLYCTVKKFMLSAAAVAACTNSRGLHITCPDIQGTVNGLGANNGVITAAAGGAAVLTIICDTLINNGTGLSIETYTIRSLYVRARLVDYIRTTTLAVLDINTTTTLLCSGGIINGNVGSLTHAAGICTVMGLVTNFTGTGSGECRFTLANAVGTCTFSSVGECNYYITEPVQTGFQNNADKTFNVTGAGARVHIVGSWRVFNHVWNISAGYVSIDADTKYYITDNTNTGVPFRLTGTGALTVAGTVDNARPSTPAISMVAGTTLISKGGTLITANQQTPLIQVVAAAQNIKVYASGLHTNYTTNLLTDVFVETRRYDVTASGVVTSMSLNDGSGIEAFSTVAAADNDMVTALVGLINGSGTLDLTATQVALADAFFTVSGDTAAIDLTASLLVNLTETVVNAFGSFGLTNVIGGSIIQDVDVE